MKLVMLGYFGFGNAGDEAVLAAEVEALRDAAASAGLTAEFVVVSGDVEHTKRIHGLPAVSRTDFPAILRVLRRSDGLVSGGGSLLQDVTSARPVAFYGGVMLAAKLLRKPVFVYAQGLGPIRRKANRFLAGLALRNSSYVSLRDSDSGALASALGVRELDLVPDPVLGLEVGDVARSDRLAVALRPWEGQETWLPAVISVLKTIAADTEVVFVPFHAGQDVTLAREVAGTLGLPGESVVEPDGGYRAAVEAIAGSRAVLGMRLHALIAAAAARRPFVALSYDPKVSAFAEQAGAPIGAVLPGPVDVERLLFAVRKKLKAEESPQRPEDARKPAMAIVRSFRE